MKQKASDDKKHRPKAKIHHAAKLHKDEFKIARLYEFKDICKLYVYANYEF